MGTTLEETLAGLLVERRAKIAARTAALIAEEQSLSELRRARSLTSTGSRQEAQHRAGEHLVDLAYVPEGCEPATDHHEPHASANSRSV